MTPSLIFHPHQCQRSNLECMIMLINERGEEAGLSGLLLMNMKARRLCRHSPSVELVSPAPALASSQSVSQQASKQASKQTVGSAAAWPLCRNFPQHDKSGRCRIKTQAIRRTETFRGGDTRTQEDVLFYESGTCARRIKVWFPTRACLNQRGALVPCVGRTTSTKRVATTAVRRHDSETGLGGRRLFALLSGQGTCVFFLRRLKKRKGGGKKTKKQPPQRVSQFSRVLDVL